MANAIESGMVASVVAAAEATSFIARQPIFDRVQRVFGYELLFRSGFENYFTGEGDSATRQTLDTAIFQGLDALTHGTKAFLNCTRDSLTNGLVTVLPPASTVLEILETVEVDDEVLAACSELKKLGFQIALDDFVPGTSCDRLIGLADYIKLDFRANAPEELAAIQRHLRRSGVRMALLAEKVETADEFERAKAAGYHYFQGYFFAQPKVLAVREIPGDRLLYLRLLSAVSKDPSDTREIEQLVMANAAICYRLLRLVNSAGFGVRGQVTSIRRALLLVGDDGFRKLVTVAAAACFAKETGHATELTTLCLQRARFCELLAPLVGQPPAEQYLIGMLSVIDAMLGLPMEHILSVLSLRPPADEVLLGRASPIDVPLRLVECYERGDWKACSTIGSKHGLKAPRLKDLYLESLLWANRKIHDAGL